MYEYAARCVGVIDGVSAVFDIDLGFDVHHEIRLQLAGIRHPTEGMEYKEGVLASKEATMALRDLILGHKLTILSSKDPRPDSKFYVGTIYVTEGDEQVNINMKMVELGHAVESEELA